MRMRVIALCCVCCAILMIPLRSIAQNSSELKHIISQRMSRIDYYHIGCGLTSEFNQNFYVGPSLFVGLGSERNFIGADMGVNYLFGNYAGGSPRVSSQQLVGFASFDINAIRWSGCCLFLGGAIDWRIPINSSYHDKLQGQTIEDSKIANSHTSVKARLGCRLNGHWRAELSYTYCLAPAFDQKYVFETKGFDYDGLHSSLFERARIGVTMSYILPL